MASSGKLFEVLEGILFHLEHGRRVSGDCVRMSVDELEGKVREALKYATEPALHNIEK